MFQFLITAGICSALLTWMVIGGVRGMDRRQGPRLDAVALTYNEVADLCAPVPTPVDGERIRRYRGTLVPNPVEGPGTFGTFGSPRGGPLGGRFIELDDGELLVMTAGLDGLFDHELNDNGEPVDRPLAGKTIGDRVSFCATIGTHTYWWPKVGYRTGLFGGSDYAPPLGPYSTARWIMDLDPLLGG